MQGAGKLSDLVFIVWVQMLLLLVVSGWEEPDLVRALAGVVLASVFVQNCAFFAQLISPQSHSLALPKSEVAISDQSSFFSSLMLGLTR